MKQIGDYQKTGNAEHPIFVVGETDQPRTLAKTEATDAPNPKSTSNEGSPQHRSVLIEENSDT
jgi:hypothetical protein